MASCVSRSLRHRRRARSMNLLTAEMSIGSRNYSIMQRNASLSAAVEVRESVECWKPSVPAKTGEKRMLDAGADNHQDEGQGEQENSQPCSHPQSLLQACDLSRHCRVTARSSWFLILLQQPYKLPTSWYQDAERNQKNNQCHDR